MRVLGKPRKVQVTAEVAAIASIPHHPTSPSSPRQHPNLATAPPPQVLLANYQASLATLTLLHEELHNLHASGSSLQAEADMDAVKKGLSWLLEFVMVSGWEMGVLKREYVNFVRRDGKEGMDGGGTRVLDI